MENESRESDVIEAKTDFYHVNSKRPNIILVIEDTQVPCNKEELCEHSDYFKIMFSGNFIESDKGVITLKDIPLKEFNIILGLICHPSVYLEDDILISVLEVCAVLQFSHISDLLIPRLINTLSVHNCIEYWVIGERLGLKRLTEKSKGCALINFEELKNTDAILKLDLKQLHAYLSNTKLPCSSEILVLGVCMKWWNYHSVKETGITLCRNDVFLRFLCCLDFGNLDVCDIQEIILIMKISTNEDLFKILNYVIEMKQSISINAEDQKAYDWATRLNNSLPRISNYKYCMVLRSEIPRRTISDACPNNLDEDNKNLKLQTLGQLIICYIDEPTLSYVEIGKVPDSIWRGLTGHRVLSYLDNIFFVGGEYGLGKSHWSKKIWSYSYITETWKAISMPYPRRHFAAIVGGNRIYIIGGTGQYRIVEKNMFWYDILQDQWSDLYDIPITELKAVYYKNTAWLLCPLLKCFYMFDHAMNTWKTIKIHFPVGVLCCHSHLIYNLMSCDKYIYIIGSCFIKITATDTHVDVIDCKMVNNSCRLFCQTAAVIFSNTIYIYRKSNANLNKYTLFEKYKIELGEAYTRNEIIHPEYSAMVPINVFAMRDFVSEHNVVNKFRL